MSFIGLTRGWSIPFYFVCFETWEASLVIRQDLHSDLLPLPLMYCFLYLSLKKMSQLVLIPGLPGPKRQNFATIYSQKSRIVKYKKCHFNIFSKQAKWMVVSFPTFKKAKWPSHSISGTQFLKRPNGNPVWSCTASHVLPPPTLKMSNVRFRVFSTAFSLDF